jgi:hypothetical protein
MCAYLVELDILGAGDAPYVLLNAVDARITMGRRSLAIVHLLISTGNLILMWRARAVTVSCRCKQLLLRFPSFLDLPMLPRWLKMKLHIVAMRANRSANALRDLPSPEIQPIPSPPSIILPWIGGDGLIEMGRLGRFDEATGECARPMRADAHRRYERQC